jgi:hypothetical protein
MKMNKIGLFAAAIAIAASPVAAAAPEALGPPLAGMFPDSIVGVKCSEDTMMNGGDTYVWSCRADDFMKHPWSNFFVTTSGKPLTEAMQMDSARDALHDRQIIKAKEESFAPKSMPGAVGFKGYYQTDLGNRMIWSVYHEGKVYGVMVFILEKTDMKKLTSEIESKFFGVGTLAGGVKKP